MQVHAGATKTGDGFSERFVEADGFRIRYLEAGFMVLTFVYLHGAGGLSLTPAHELLARRFHVIAFEMPGFGGSAENTRTQNRAELGATMAEAARRAGAEYFNLWERRLAGQLPFAGRAGAGARRKSRAASGADPAPGVELTDRLSRRDAQSALRASRANANLTGSRP